MSIPINLLAQAVIKPSDHAIAQFKSKQIYKALHEHGVSELAYKNFNHKSALSDALSVRAKTSIATEMARTHEIEMLVKQLNTKKINYIVFKGSALAYFTYKNAWQRPRGDTDLLIDHTQLSQTADILISLGYQAVTSISGKYISYQTSFNKKVTSSFIHSIDVHWRISNRQILSNTYTLDDLLVNAKKSTLNSSTEMNIPSTIDAILLAAQHRKGHHAEKERLIWLYDIHLLCNEMEKDQWPMLIAKARSKKIAYLTYDALDLTRSLFYSKIPAQVTDALEQAKGSDEPSAIFLEDARSELAIFWADLMQGLPDWPSRLCLLKEHLFPSRAYLKARNGNKTWLFSLFKRLFSGALHKLKNKKTS